MSLKYHSINSHYDPANLFGAVSVFIHDNDNKPPRARLRECPIVALHWYGVNVEAGQ